ncbi:nuclear transport factor 2 family protein [Modestobacter excelsi]|uniref:nuclear transport factor 2 family protein n=1 Tax=Modestobacter excelsi TaxID=2213161 RepID=UPI001C20F185|nr:nuclear transport factor 2 family protein [Modestobacter excelsi]
MTDSLSATEVTALRELLDKQAIQDVMTRYARLIDRRDPQLSRTIFWEEGTDDHGLHKGSAEGFLASVLANPRGILTAYHNLGPASVEFVGGHQAKVESYFLYVCTREWNEGLALGTLTGRYRDLFEKRNGEWRVLHRTVVYDTSSLTPYEPAWKSFGMEKARHSAAAPDDPIYEASW